MKRLIVRLFFLLFFLNHCSFFPPINIYNDSMFIIENEIPGTYKGIKFFFNRYNELTVSTNAIKTCKNIDAQHIQCIENYNIKEKKRNKEYCFFYEYHNPYNVSLNYLSNCKNYSNFTNYLFSDYNKIRGGGFILITYDQEPLENQTLPISLYYVRGIKNKYYYEEKKYYFLFWQIGKEITIWEKL
ncbi:MAG: hypothetical protein KatS3mg129_2585 [Leptospiraceae bacterium]|nr:MAG: hypothetical protein KatS3mg129_2585 [Leptospiraceae bacterium]